MIPPDQQIRKYSVTLRHVVAEITLTVWDKGLDHDGAVAQAMEVLNRAPPEALAANMKVLFPPTFMVERCTYIESTGDNDTGSQPQPALVPVAPIAPTVAAVPANS